MTTTSGPVTELVEIPLVVPFDDFLSIFTRQLEPVLLAQQGLISVLTGTASKATSGQQDGFAVSLTQWESMDAHAAFLQGPTAGPFFETLKSLTSGPPTINHYYIGPLTPEAFRSRYAWFQKYSSADRHVQSQESEQRGVDPGVTTLVGDCFEIGSQRLSVSFSDIPRSRVPDDAGEPGGPGNLTTVVWRRRGTARVSHNL